MFKKLKRKYTITFRKLRVVTKKGSVRVIYDGSITDVLYSLRKRFGFDVVRIELGSVDCVSKIIIKAHSSQKDEIFQEFCNKLQGHVYNTTLR